MVVLPTDPQPREPRPPRRRPPRGTTDCHFHIFESPDKYPLSPDRFYNPAFAPVSAYLKMAASLGIERMVVVNGSPYRTDNSCTLAAIADFGLHRARGVAVVSPSIGDAELARLKQGGIRGIRINTINGGTALADLPAIAERIRPHGMHLQLWTNSENYHLLCDILGDIGLPVVIDHMGQIPAEWGTDHDHFRSLLKLLESGRVWVKLIGYRISKGPPYSDLSNPAACLLRVAEDRCIWGTDWPHPTLSGRQMPDDGELLDALESWCTDTQLEKVLVRNPANLYGF